MVANPAALRDRLLHEAIGILGREGGTGLTVRAVAKAAGCSTMGVYTHFDGKPGLLDAIVFEGYDAFDAAVEDAAHAVDHGRDQLTVGARAYRAWALGHRTQYQVMFTPFVPGFDPQPATLERGAQSFQTHLARVSRALERGEIEGDVSDAEAIATHVWACVHGHVMLDILMSVQADDAPAGERFERYVAWILAGLSAR